MSVSVSLQQRLTVTETLEGNTASAIAAKRKVIHDALNVSKALTASTTPPVTTVAAFEQAMDAGAATIDLTALVGTNGAEVDGTGLKVQGLLLVNKVGNANNITVSKGAANGYELWGAGDVILTPGQSILFFGNDATPDVAAGAKDIDIAGTLAQVLQVVVVLG